MTDANIMLGRIQPGHFPAVFGDNGDEPLDAQEVARSFADLADTIGDGRSPEEVAAGFLRIAVNNMADAIKKISVQRGHDITRYTLSSFGGAGGQHACAVADALGMTQILIHPSPVCSRRTAWASPTSPPPARPPSRQSFSIWARAGSTAVAPWSRTRELSDQGIPVERVDVVRRAHLKWRHRHRGPGSVRRRR